MHALAASHIVASLALATCTISANDGADFGFLQFKAAQLLRLAENNGSKTLGNTWYVSYPVSQISIYLWLDTRAIAFALLCATFGGVSKSWCQDGVTGSGLVE
jgi:hypothetical protein